MPRDPNVGVGTAVVLVDREDKVLLMKRRSSHADGCWAVPGGWLDFEDKNLVEAAAREVLEEVALAIDISKVTFDPVVTYENHGTFNSVTLYFFVPWTAWSGSPTIMEPNKCEKLIWHSLHEPPPSPSFPNLEVALEKIRHANILWARLRAYQEARENYAEITNPRDGYTFQRS